MKCAIQLIFSDENQKVINILRKKLDDAGVHDEAVQINHISLADIEIEESQLPLVESILKKFADNHKSLNIVLSSVGSFMTSENVIFIAPTMTEDLIQYNDELVKLLSENNIACGRYYIKNNWQPHCTISIRLNDEELIKGFKIIKENIVLPMEIFADSIDLLCYNPKPYRELINFKLK